MMDGVDRVGSLHSGLRVLKHTPLPSRPTSLPDSMVWAPITVLWLCPSRFALLVSTFVSDRFPERLRLFLALDDRPVVHGIAFVTHDATWLKRS